MQAFLPPCFRHRLSRVIERQASRFRAYGGVGMATYSRHHQAGGTLVKI